MYLALADVDTVGDSDTMTKLKDHLSLYCGAKVVLACEYIIVEQTDYIN